MKRKVIGEQSAREARHAAAQLQHPHPGSNSRFVRMQITGKKSHGAVF
jgi:hypothetical protein